MAPEDDDLRALWLRQSGGASEPAKEPLRFTPLRFTVEELQRRETQLRRKVRFRNATELAACALVLVWSIVSFIGETSLGRRVAFAAMGIATLSVATKFLRAGSPRPPPAAGASTTAHTTYFRAELERQRDFLFTVPRWYLGPLSAALFLFYGIDLFTVRAGLSFGARLAEIAPLVAVTAVVIVFAGWLNRRAARKLQEKIDALEA
jgi:hypothetical protein